MLQNYFFLDFRLFWPFFKPKNSQKNKLKNKQNPNRLMKFSEIWYVDASQQTKMPQKNLFWILAFFNQKTAKIDKKLRRLAKSKPFDDIF